MGTGRGSPAVTLPQIPEIIMAPLVLLAVWLVAWIVHHGLVSLLQRFLAARQHSAHAIIAGARHVSLLAFFVATGAVVVPLLPVSVALKDTIDRVLLAAFILLLGWIAIIAANIGLERYARQFRLDSADNLLARKAVTQVRVLKRAVGLVIALLALGFALMSFESVRNLGVSLFASAGIGGILAGLAARPLLGNLFAGMQIAITQPIRLGDVVVLNGQWGSIEEINSTYVVMKLWDWRRYVVPLSYFFDNPFENWTRSSSAILGSVFLYVDYSVPVDRLRQKLNDIVRGSALWDGNVVNLQVTDAKENSVELRALVSAADSGKAWDLRCEVREKLLAHLQERYPEALPRSRTSITLKPRNAALPAKASTH
jgi:small-conductance mechanosensitive channel